MISNRLSIALEEIRINQPNNPDLLHGHKIRGVNSHDISGDSYSSYSLDLKPDLDPRLID